MFSAIDLHRSSFDCMILMKWEKVRGDTINQFAKVCPFLIMGRSSWIMKIAHESEGLDHYSF